MNERIQTLLVLAVVLTLQVVVGKYAPEQTQVAGILGAIAMSFTQTLLGSAAKKKNEEQKPEEE